MTNLRQVQFCGAYRINKKQLNQLDRIDEKGRRAHHSGDQIAANKRQFLAKISKHPANEFMNGVLINHPKGGLILTQEDAGAYLQTAQGILPVQRKAFENQVRDQMWPKAVNVNKKSLFHRILTLPITLIKFLPLLAIGGAVAFFVHRHHKSSPQIQAG